MCGFVGYIDSKIKDKKVIKDMNDTIIHRGPDDEGYYSDTDINIGFRRLSIIDLKHGKQPMTNKDKSVVITFNGEIYNYQELQTELKKKGYTFKTNSDTETILKGYEEYGTKVVSKLRGMFAFIIWDKNKKQLFGARDYFGIKPFYYYKNKDTFIWGSEIKSFLKNPHFKKELNKKSLKSYLTFQYSVLDETFFKNVYRLNPGHYFTFKDGKLKIDSYFDFSYTESQVNLEQLIKDIDNQIHSSVKYHRISDVKVGAFLSGGVDSSYIVSVLKPDTTYSVGFDYQKFNETNYAKELSDILKINNKRQLITPEEFFDSLDKVQYHSDEPHANLSAVPLYHLSALAAKDVKVVLSGEGADELYGGYESYNPTPTFLRYQKIVPKGIRKAIKNFAINKKYFKGQQFLIKAGSDIEDYYVGQAFIFDDQEANDILNDKYKTDIGFRDITKPYFDKVKDKSDMVKKQFLDMNLWLPRDILLKADKMTMAHSLELRVPFLDKVVFKHALTIPNKFKVDKMCLRKASELTVPEEWAKRKKKGFPVPFSIWIKEDKWYKWVKDIISEDYTKEFFKQEDVLKLLEDHYNNIANNGRKIYTILCFLLWYKKYFIEL
jgi:asparagine synthase (glutamine-hydrolysing)